MGGENAAQEAQAPWAEVNGGSVHLYGEEAGMPNRNTKKRQSRKAADQSEGEASLHDRWGDRGRDGMVDIHHRRVFSPCVHVTRARSAKCASGY
jgi:hypothetical protein